MSRLRLLRSLVFLAVFITPALSGHPQKQNADERTTPSLPARYPAAAPANMGQRVSLPGARFDPRQRLHAPGASTPQTTALADALAAASLVAGTSVDASTIFLEAPVFSSGGFAASSVAVADVNGDSKPDLVVANYRVGSSDYYSNGTVGVLLGNGDGTFQPAVGYDSGGQGANSIAVADVNGDGKPDLLVTNCAPTSTNCSGVVGVLMGNGDGTFQAVVTYLSGGVAASSVAIADVNGDGKPDLVVSNQCADSSCAIGSLGVLLGNGDGTFRPAVSYSSGGLSATSVTVCDVNGDGKPDILVGNLYAGNGDYSRGSVGVLLGNGDGTFQGPVSLDSGGEHAYSVVLGDLNADGKLDLVVANQGAGGSSSDGAVSVLLGNGDGTFRPAVSYDSGGQNAESLTVADVSGDGVPDVIVANQCASANCSDGSMSVLLGNGKGGFKPAISYDSGAHYAVSVAVADVNSDGKADVLVLNQYSLANTGAVAVMLGNGDGTFQAAESLAWGGSWAYSIAAGDVNGDGKLDMIVAGQSTTGTAGATGVLLGKGDGTFQPATSYSSGLAWAYSVAIADVNQDGKQDLVMANYDGTAGVLLGNGDGTFHAVVTYGSGGNNAYSIGVADVNGDGVPDLLVANGCMSVSNCTNGGLAVLLGRGDGTFQAAVSYSSGGQIAYSLSIADLNGDGKPDVVVANKYAGNVSSASGSVGVFSGNGDGTFQPAVSYNSGGYAAQSVAVADVNGDGRPDLLVTNGCVSQADCSHGALGVLLGNGDGTFQSATTITTPPTGFGSVAVADFNGDGSLDVASGAGNFLLLGNGDGTFQPPLDLGVTGPGISVGDFNLDGKPDLAVGGVSILLNVSTPTTRIPTTTTLTSSPNPSTVDRTVNFVATIVGQNGGSPSGTVTFKDGANTVGTAYVSTCNCASRGTATLPLATLGVGSHTITAVYGGDPNFAGSHSITASYGGNSNFAGSTSAASTQTVNKANTTIAISAQTPNPSVAGQPVTVNFTLTPLAPGR